MILNVTRTGKHMSLNIVGAVLKKTYQRNNTKYRASSRGNITTFTGGGLLGGGDGSCTHIGGGGFSSGGGCTHIGGGGFGG